MSCANRQRLVAAVAASWARIEAAHAETRRAVATGMCPECGLPVWMYSRWNGRWKCVANSAPRMRDPKYRDARVCLWQGFTE